MLAGLGRRASSATAATRTTARSSGAMSAMKNNRMAQMVARNPGKSAIAGGAVLGGVAMGRTRKSGLDKTRGRPTGMYGY
jgi:hypothetical protein